MTGGDMWTSQEKDAIWKKWCDDDHLDDVVRAEQLAVFAVGLMAARGGTMTAGRMPDHDRDKLLSFVEAGHTLSDDQASAMLVEMDRARDVEVAQGATVAALQAKVVELEKENAEAKEHASLWRKERDRLLKDFDNLRAEVERLKADMAWSETQRAQALLGMQAAEFRLAAVRERTNAGQEHLLGIWGSAEVRGESGSVAIARWVLEGDAPQEGKTEAGVLAHGGTLHRCSAACTGAEPQEATGRLCSVGEAFVPAVIEAAVMRRALGRVAHLRKRETRWREAGDIAAASEFREQADILEWVLTGKRPSHPDSTEPRYPCFSTCTHDDAANPGHPERVRRLGAEVMAMAGGVPKTEAPALSRSCPHKPRYRNTCGDCEYDRGAEAMREACWEAVKTEFQKHGLTYMDTAWKAARDAIEGAAP